MQIAPGHGQGTPYGSVSLSPTDPVVAGSFGTWVLTYTVGAFGMDDGGGLKVVMKHSSDWGTPQFEDPAAANYVRVFTSGAARARPRWDPRTHVRPWSKGLVINLQDGYLSEGDTITIVWGDASGGSPGMQAQSFLEDAFEFRVLVDCFASGLFLHLPDSPTLQVVSGPAAGLVAVTPSDAWVGEATRMLVRAVDRWGNPASGYRGTVSLEGTNVSGLPASHAFTPDDAGAHSFTALVPTSPGRLRLRAIDRDSGLSAESNPIACYEARPERRLLWGDTQGQTGDTVGTGTTRGFYSYARDAAGLDFAVHSGNDFQITREFHAERLELSRAFHQPHRFVTFPSYEWSGNTAVGGDHNVLFLDEERSSLHRSSHALIPDRSDEDTDRTTVAKLYSTLRAEGAPVLLIPHVGGRRANLDMVDPELCPVIEIASVHGWFEWFAQDALARSLKVGFLGASDDHTCRPGASYPTKPEFSVRSSLAGVYATDLTREAIWEALRARHCFATTGERIRLMLRAGDRIMGDELVASSSPALEVEVDGTKPLEMAEIVRGSEVIYRHRFPELQQLQIGRRLRVKWKGARVKGRGRWAAWNGGLSVENGRILKAEPWAFHSPRQSITGWDERHVSWISTTSGDARGVILDLETSPDTTLRFAAGDVDLTVPLSQIGRDPWVQSLGGLEREVALEWMPVGRGPETASFSFTDPDPLPGLNAYYLRIRQEDGSMAWSSPIFVTL